MGNYLRNIAFLMGGVLILENYTEVLADCNNYWLDRYEDVLPSINNRPEFPESITDAFEVCMI